MARLLCGAQHLVDEALGLARSCAADAPGPDAEVLSATAHRRKPEGTRYRTVPKVALKSLSVCLVAARDPTERHGERQALTRAWMTTGEPLLSCLPWSGPLRPTSLNPKPAICPSSVRWSVRPIIASPSHSPSGRTGLRNSGRAPKDRRRDGRPGNDPAAL